VTKYLVWELRNVANKQLMALGSPILTSEPHSAFQRNKRDLWRHQEQRHPNVHWRDSAGLMYAVWSFTNGISKPDAIVGARGSDPDGVYVIASKNTWDKVCFSVHPDNPIVFTQEGQGS
jgi:hypothetical protein